MLFIIAIVALFGQVECLGYHTRRSKPIALDSVVHDLLAQCGWFVNYWLL